MEKYFQLSVVVGHYNTATIDLSHIQLIINRNEKEKYNKQR